MDIYLYVIPFICLAVSLLLSRCEAPVVVLLLILYGVLTISLLSQIISGFISDYGIMKSNSIPFWCFVINAIINVFYSICLLSFKEYKIKFIFNSTLVSFLLTSLILLIVHKGEVNLVKILLLFIGSFFFAVYSWHLCMKDKKYQYLIFSMIAFLLSLSF